MKKVVGLKGLGDLTLEIYLYLNLFKVFSDFKLPGWKNLKKLYSPSDVLNLTNTSSGKSDIINFIDLNPFLVDNINVMLLCRHKNFSYSLLRKQAALN